MLEYLKLTIDTDVNLVTATLRAINGMLMIACQNDLHPETDSLRALSRSESARLLTRLDEIHLEQWDAVYTAQQAGRKNIYWSLEYQNVCGDRATCCGYHAYPPNWSAFWRLMSTVAPLPFTQRVDKITIRYLAGSAPEDSSRIVNAPAAGKLRVRENLVLDRLAETLTLTRRTSAGNWSVQRYHLAKQIPELMDDCAGRLEDAGSMAGLESEPTQNSPVYLLILRFQDGTEKRVAARYNRLGLPVEWATIAAIIAHLAEQSARADLLNAQLFSSGIRAGEVIYCSVVFPSGGKTYYYRTQDATLRAGDRVIVPAGPANREVTVQIEKVEYFPSDALPMPFDQVKAVLRRVEALPDTIPAPLPVKKKRFFTPKKQNAQRQDADQPSRPLRSMLQRWAMRGKRLFHPRG